MQTTNNREATDDEITILSRVLVNGREKLTPDLARYFLDLGFSDKEKARMHDLAVRNQEGTISAKRKKNCRLMPRQGAFSAF